MPAERRTQDRVRVDLDALLVAEQCVEPDRGKVADISRDGALVLMPTPLTLGQRLRLILKLDQGRGVERLSLPARVVRSLQGGVALRFGQVDVVSRAALEQFITRSSPGRGASLGKPMVMSAAMAKGGLRDLFRRIFGR